MIELAALQQQAGRDEKFGLEIPLSKMGSFHKLGGGGGRLLGLQKLRIRVSLGLYRGTLYLETPREYLAVGSEEAVYRIPLV